MINCVSSSRGSCSFLTLEIFSRENKSSVPDLSSFPASLLGSFGVVRLTNPDEAEGAFNAEMPSGFLGRFGKRGAVPEDGPAGDVIESIR